MVTRQPHHEQVWEVEDAEDRTDSEGPCGDVAAYVLGVLDPAQHVIFARHLAGCESCQGDAADFGVFAPVLRQCVGPPASSEPCRVTRSLVMLAAGFVVAVAAVLSVVQSQVSHVDDPVEVSVRNQALVHVSRVEPFALYGLR